VTELINDIEDSLRRLDGAAVLDILIISVIIFALLMALRGTTAMTLLRGIVVIVALVFLLGQVLDLRVVNFIIRNSLPGLVLGIIVIFQPEIRRALERAGRTRLRAWLYGEEPMGAIDAIASAVSEMARERHGAIIVLERSTGLDEYAETGVRLNAELSSQLLEGIFYPNSPLHDKAVIVKDDRIIAASCTLPMAEGRGAARLGTRHRAALGVTEQTDAVSVVVSEETGAISVATDGRLIRLRDESGLRSTLQALVSSSSGILARARAS
jgi:diadenylate cyclase